MFCCLAIDKIFTHNYAFKGKQFHKQVVNRKKAIVKGSHHDGKLFLQNLCNSYGTCVF